MHSRWVKESLKCLFGIRNSAHGIPFRLACRITKSCIANCILNCPYKHLCYALKNYFGQSSVTAADKNCNEERYYAVHEVADSRATRPPHSVPYTLQRLFGGISLFSRHKFRFVSWRSKFRISVRKLVNSTEVSDNLLLLFIFWVVTPCTLVGRYQLLWGTLCLYLQTWSWKHNVPISWYLPRSL